MLARRCLPPHPTCKVLSPQKSSSSRRNPPRRVKEPAAAAFKANPQVLFHFPLNKSIEDPLSGRSEAGRPPAHNATLFGGLQRGVAREIPAGSSPALPPLAAATGLLHASLGTRGAWRGQERRKSDSLPKPPPEQIGAGGQGQTPDPRLQPR